MSYPMLNAMTHTVSRSVFPPNPVNFNPLRDRPNEPGDFAELDRCRKTRLFPAGIPNTPKRTRASI